MKEVLLKKRYGIPTALLLILVFVGLVSAAVYWAGTQKLSQTVKKVANGTMANSTIALPNINEGESKTYTTEEVTDFDKALSISIWIDGTRTLSVDFTNVSGIKTLYDSYQLKVIVDSVPSGSTVTVGSTVLTVDLSKTTDSVGLDKAGTYVFDYEVTVTAGNVTTDTTKNAEFKFKVK